MVVSGIKYTVLTQCLPTACHARWMLDTSLHYAYNNNTCTIDMYIDKECIILKYLIYQ
jgi:hypothetical protein